MKKGLFSFYHSTSQQAKDLLDSAMTTAAAAANAEVDVNGMAIYYPGGLQAGQNAFYSALNAELKDTPLSHIEFAPPAMAVDYDYMNR